MVKKEPLMEWEKARPPKYWEYRRQWDEYGRTKVVRDFPIHVDIETTNICNLGCTMCPRTILVEQNRFDRLTSMDFDFYKNLIDQIAQNGGYSIKLMYLGEPLLHRDVFRQIKYAKDKGIVEVMLNTNATHLNEDVSRKLLEAGLDSIFFSLDSFYRERFNAIRVGAEFNEVVENIKTFMRVKEEYGDRYKHVQTRVAMVVLKDTTDQEIIDFTNYWLPIVGQVGFNEVKEYASIAQYNFAYNPEFVCWQPFQRILIRAEGRVSPCIQDDYGGYIVGNAKTQRLKDIWHSEKFTALREAHKNGRFRDINICKNCFMANIAINNITPTSQKVLEPILQSSSHMNRTTEEA